MRRFFSKKPKKVTKILLIVVSSSCAFPKSLLASGRVVNSSGLTKIDNGLGESILNDSSAILQNSPGNARLEIKNFGLIKSNNAQAIYSSENSSELLIDNSGIIEGKTVAIHVAARNLKPTDNILKQTEIINKEQATIKGSILFAGNASFKSSITNSGTIIGDIDSRNASNNELSITNQSGSITGNIYLGSNSKSSFTLNGGSINGNLTSGNSSQSLNLNGGTFNGDVSLASGSTLNLGNSEVNGTVNGNIFLIAGSGLSGVSKINGVVNGNISLLSQTSLSLGNTKVNGTINSNSSGINKITTLSTTNILNDSSAILQNSPGNARLEIKNFGLIKSNNAQAIYSSENSSELLIDNSGIIEGKTVAIHVAARNLKPTDNILKQTEIINKEQATIKGSILFAGNASFKSSITNSGTIIGDIDSRNASNNELSITNQSGSITGNIYLGSNSKSSFTLNGGSINGNLTSGNSSQSLNLNGGTFNGDVSLASGSTLNLGNSEVNGTVNGNIFLIAGSGLSGVSKINGVVNGNISLLSQTSLSLGNTKVNGTINSNSSGINKITTLSTTNILNDSSAILQNSPGNARLEIKNFGLIKSNNAQAIYSSENSSELLIDNSGIIEGKTVAIHVAARNLKPTDNILKQTEIINKEQATIKGSILFAGNASFKSSITNSGTIIGDIDSRNASNNELSITNQSGSITGNIYLGSNSKSSFTLNGGSINGNLTSGNSSQSLNLNGGTFNGDVSLASGSTLNLGNSEVNGTVNGNIFLIAGSGLSGVSKINGVVNGNISLLSQTSLSLGNTKVNGTINSNSSGINKITTLSTTNILNDSSAILQNSPGNARLEIKNFGLIKSNNAQAIYSSENSSELLIDNSGIIEGKTVAIHVAARNLKPTDNILKQTEIINKEQATIKGSILFAGNASFKSSITNSGTIIGDIDSRNASNNELSITNQSGSITGNIYLGSNSKSSFTLNGGSINGNLTSGNSSQSLNLNGGTFNGDVSLASGSTLNLGNSEVNGNLDISLNSILNLRSNNIKAKNISLNGVMNFGDTSKNITGNVTGAGNATLNLGSSSHDIIGNLSLKSGDNINIDLTSDNNLGKLKVTGITIIDSNTNLNVTINSNYKFIADGTKYVIIDGENGSSISAINDSNININNSSSNKFSLLTFNTTSDNNDLILNATRKSAETITSDKTSQNAYNIINEIGSSATGELRSIQEYLDKSSNMSQVTNALNSITPQEKNSIKFSHVNVINSSVKTTENRMDEIHFASLVKTNDKKSEVSTTRTSYEKNKNYILKKSSGISLGDSFEDNAIWVQTFGTAAKQDNINQNDGYSSQSLGFAFG